VTLALPFLILIGLVLPLLAWNSHRQVTSSEVADDALPSLRALALQTIVLQTVVFGFAWLASASAGITVSWSSQLGPISLLGTIAVFALAMAVAWMEARRPLEPPDVLRRILWRASPTDPAWLTLTVVAGIAEEFAYRGVLTGLLTIPLGAGTASIVSAGVFGLGHFTQGWRGLVYSAGFGLALQGVVVLSGGLLLAIVVHVAYDLCAARLGRRPAQ
jgi:membrane protease YdiL (CAAX protease family)